MTYVTLDRINRALELRAQGWPLGFWERDTKLAQNRALLFAYEDAGSWWTPARRLEFNPIATENQDVYEGPESTYDFTPNLRLFPSCNSLPDLPIIYVEESLYNRPDPYTQQILMSGNYRIEVVPDPESPERYESE